MEYPTKQDIGNASHVQLLRWSRFLPSPRPDQVSTMNYIISRMNQLGPITPELSKQVGWQ